MLDKEWSLLKRANKILKNHAQMKYRKQNDLHHINIIFFSMPNIVREKLIEICTVYTG